MTDRFVGDRRGLHPLIYRRKAASDSHEGYPRANLSETRPPTRPKERDIYRADLKYKVASGDREKDVPSLLFSERSRPRGYDSEFRSRAEAPCPEIRQRPMRMKDVRKHRTKNGITTVAFFETNINTAETNGIAAVTRGVMTMKNCG